MNHITAFESATSANAMAANIVSEAVSDPYEVFQRIGALTRRLHDALQALAALDERKSRVVELRYFGGLNVDETAQVLGVSSHTVTRDWNMAKAWLHQQLNKG